MLDLIEAKLYAGAIHSERRVTSAKGTLIRTVLDSHPLLGKHLELEIATIALNISQNIFNCRMNIYKIASETNKIELLNEIQSFHKRYLQSINEKTSKN